MPTGQGTAFILSLFYLTPCLFAAIGCLIYPSKQWSHERRSPVKDSPGHRKEGDDKGPRSHWKTFAGPQKRLKEKTELSSSPPQATRSQEASECRAATRQSVTSFVPCWAKAKFHSSPGTAHVPTQESQASLCFWQEHRGTFRGGKGQRPYLWAHLLAIIFQGPRLLRTSGEDPGHHITLLPVTCCFCCCCCCASLKASERV